MFAVYDPFNQTTTYVTTAKDALKEAKRIAHCSYLNRNESATIRIRDDETGHWYAHYRIRGIGNYITRVTYRWRDNSDNPVHHARFKEYIFNKP